MKKRILSILLTWCMVLCFMPTSAFADDIVDYGFEINGQAVTSANINSLSGVKGTVSYDQATKTLTLDNVTINETNMGTNKVIGCENSITTIKLKGKNVITVDGTSGPCIESTTKDQFTIVGDSRQDSLQITTSCPLISPIYIQNNSIINVKKCMLDIVCEYTVPSKSVTPASAIRAGGNVNIDDCNISFVGGKKRDGTIKDEFRTGQDVIYAEGDLTITNSNVVAGAYTKSTGVFATMNAKNITLTNCDLTLEAKHEKDGDGGKGSIRVLHTGDFEGGGYIKLTNCVGTINTCNGTEGKNYGIDIWPKKVDSPQYSIPENCLTIERCSLTITASGTRTDAEKQQAILIYGDDNVKKQPVFQYTSKFEYGKDAENAEEKTANETKANGYWRNKYLKITAAPTALTLDQTALELVSGSSRTLTATVTPAHAEQNVTWTSSNESVATVENGVVTAVSAGTATITASISGLNASCTVTVKNPIYSVTLNANGGTIAEGKNITQYTYGTGGTIPTAAEVTREGYRFDGWYDNEGLTGTPVTEIGSTETGDKEYWAKWEVNQYTITVKPENGEADMTITQDYGTSITAPTLTRDGYRFSGWDKEFPKTMPAENMTVTAKWLDIEVPVINGLTDGKVYCSAAEFTVSDNAGIASVTVNGTPLQAAENGKYTLSPVQDEQAVVVIDKAGNETTVSVTVNDGHTYDWQSENGQYWQKCKFCNFETAKKDIPSITITGADRVCMTQDYAFSFTLPEGATEAQWGYELPLAGDGDLTPTEKNGIYYGTITANKYGSTAGTLKVIATGRTDDGFPIRAQKYVTILVQHTGGTATCTKQAVCEVCGEKYGDLNANNHTDTTEWIQTETTHTQKYKCCGAIAVAEENHEWENGVCTECGWLCGHTLVGPGIVDKNHDHKCDLCGKTISEHSGGTATCTDKAICSICGEKYGEKNPNNHTGTTEWIQTETTHIQKYKCCEVIVVAEENHEWENGVCTECGYGCNHTYDWQSENGQYWQKCKFCNFETAKKDIPSITITGADRVCMTQDYAFSFTLPEGATEAQWGYELPLVGDGDLTPTEKNGVYYGTITANKYGSTAGTLKVIATGRTDDGFPIRAQKYVTILVQHTGGTATCTKQAVCEVCGESYGDLNAKNHTDTTEWIQTETTHTQKYKCCGAIVVAEENHEWENGVCTECGYGCNHTGGTATCKNKAVCEVCGEKYGDLISHSYSTKWSMDDKTHWHECTVCAEKTDEANHSDKNNDHKCDICEKTLSKCTDTNNDHKCDLCGKNLSEHSGGTATCIDKAKCKICGESYGEINANKHSDLKHYPTKAATKTEEGNIEYWYCDGCGRYYKDAEATKEIAKENTVITKLPNDSSGDNKLDDDEPPQTGWTPNLALWIALLLASGGTAIGTTIISRNKKYNK